LIRRIVRGIAVIPLKEDISRMRGGTALDRFSVGSLGELPASDDGPGRRFNRCPRIAVQLMLADELFQLAGIRLTAVTYCQKRVMRGQVLTLSD
jgi:hypothetical protein